MTEILIIEDDKLLLETLTDLLEDEGYQIYNAHNGNEGIRIAKETIPDLIISDINMPGMNGHDVLKALLQDPDTSNIPFIFLTGDADISAIRKGMSLGADDYIPKPVIPNDLLKSVQIRIRKHQKFKDKYEEQLTRTRYDLELTKNYDPITRLPRKTVLENDYEYQKNAYKVSNTALIIIKIDRLRELIEILEPSAYKEIIKIIVGRVQTVMSDNQKLYWLDNDLLGLYIGFFQNNDELCIFTKKLLQQINQTIRYEQKKFRFTANLGISISTKRNCSIRDLLTESEMALSYAQSNGHNTFQFFTSDLKNMVHEKINIENELHRAIENEEFYLLYQPKFNLLNGSVVGMEALIRWNSPQYGTLLPSRFIPIAEQNGLIVSLGEWITKRICTQVKKWINSGLKVPRIAINVSGNQLEESNFVHSLAEILNDEGINGDALELELTESILVRNSSQTHQKLIEIKQLGLNISIDDFGTGYSSLQYLKNFPHDRIKIDRSFINDLEMDKNSKSIVSSIISMAHGMGVKVVAEGVENQKQVEILKNQRCDEIQGFYYSKPILPEEIHRFIF